MTERSAARKKSVVDDTDRFKVNVVLLFCTFVFML